MNDAGIYMGSGAQEPNYQELKQFFEVFSSRYFQYGSLPPEHQPIKVLEKLEKTKPSTAFRGLRQAINDCIEMSQRFNMEEVSALDIFLAESGIVTLSRVRELYSKSYRKIVQRGFMKDEVEYYLMRNVLSDPTPKTDEHLAQLETLIIDYEKRSKSPRKYTS